MGDVKFPACIAARAARSQGAVRVPQDVASFLSPHPVYLLTIPRVIREEFIRRVHRRFGPERAVLAGAIGTYSAKGIT